MKWIGQSLVDFIARFRSDVYLDSPTAGGSDPDKFLGIDSDGKIIYRTGTEVLSDIGGAASTSDITRVSFTTDSGIGGAIAKVNSGNADFNILGGEGIDVTNTTGGAGSLTIDIIGEEASTSNKGIVELATTAETNTGTDTGRVVTPAGLTAWTGDTALVTVGTIGTGAWQGTAIATAYIADDAITFAKASGVTPNIYGNVIKLIPSDFLANDDGGNTKFGIGYVETAGTGYGMRVANNATELYAFVSIPEDMKATSVIVYDKLNLAVAVFEAQINATTMAALETGNCNASIDITDTNSTATNFLVIQVTTTNATNDKIYGGAVTIAAQ